MSLTPNQERINYFRTKITFETFEKFCKITNIRERQKKMINYLGEKLAIAQAEIEIYEK